MIVGELDDLEDEARKRAIEEIRETGVWESKLRFFAGRNRDGMPACSSTTARDAIGWCSP